MVVELNQGKEQILPAQRAGLIERGTTRPNGQDVVSNQSIGGNTPPKQKKVKAHEKQRELVDRILAEVNNIPEDKKGTYLFVVDRLLACGNVPLPTVSPSVKKVNDHRYIGGMCHCGKGICPLCLPYQDALRAEKLKKQAKEVVSLGLRHYLFTSTIRHHYGAKFKTLVDVERKVWRKMTSSRFWKQAVEGFAWKLEPGFSLANGHHPHKHCIVTLKTGVDVDAFAERLKKYWEDQLRKLGRSCDWKKGWWKEIPDIADVDRMIGYICKSIREVTGTSHKHNAPWLLPVDAYVEVFTTSRNVRWFGVGGCWRSKETVKCEKEEVLEQERNSKDEILVTIPLGAWTKFSFAQKFLIKDVVYDNEIDDAACVEVISFMIDEVLQC
jgi:hypothetical protein